MAAHATVLWSSRYFQPHDWVRRTVGSVISLGDNSLQRPNQPYSVCSGRGFRLDVPGSLGQGYFEAVEIAKDVYLQVLSVTLCSDFKVRLVGEENILGFGVLAGGPNLMVAESWGCQQVTEPTGYLLSVPEGEQLEAHYRPGHHYIDAKLRFHSSRFEAAFGLSGWSLPNGSGTSEIQSFEYLRTQSARATVLAYEVANCPFVGDLRYRYLQAKASELVCELLAAFQMPIADSQPPHRISKKNVGQLMRARDFVGANACRRPTLGQVARLVGMSTNKLSYGFKYLFNVSITDFQREQRLLEARRLLVETKLDVQRVAERVGYGHQSTFATAFKQWFGVSPTEYR